MYELSRKVLPGRGWRWGISFNGKLIIQSDQHRRISSLLDKLTKREKTFAPSVAFREGLNKSHLNRVIEAQGMVS
jgi:hypothetical protein